MQLAIRNETLLHKLQKNTYYYLHFFVLYLKYIFGIPVMRSTINKDPCFSKTSCTDDVAATVMTAEINFKIRSLIFKVYSLTNCLVTTF